jgi:hypothetical protein
MDTRESVNHLDGLGEDRIDPPYRFKDLRMLLDEAWPVPDWLMMEDSIAKTADCVHPV